MLILTPDFVKLLCWRWWKDPNVLILFLSLSSLCFSYSVLCREEWNFNNSLIYFHFINILSFWHGAYGEVLSTLVKDLILPHILAALQVWKTLNADAILLFGKSFSLFQIDTNLNKTCKVFFGGFGVSFLVLLFCLLVCFGFLLLLFCVFLVLFCFLNKLEIFIQR